MWHNKGGSIMKMMFKFYFRLSYIPSLILRNCYRELTCPKSCSLSCSTSGEPCRSLFADSALSHLILSLQH